MKILLQLVGGVSVWLGLQTHTARSSCPPPAPPNPSVLALTGGGGGAEGGC